MSNSDIYPFRRSLHKHMWHAHRLHKGGMHTGCGKDVYSHDRPRRVAILKSCSHSTWSCVGQSTHLWFSINFSYNCNDISNGANQDSKSHMRLLLVLLAHCLYSVPDVGQFRSTSVVSGANTHGYGHIAKKFNQTTTNLILKSYFLKRH